MPTRSYDDDDDVGFPILLMLLYHFCHNATAVVPCSIQWFYVDTIRYLVRFIPPLLFTRQGWLFI